MILLALLGVLYLGLRARPAIADWCAKDTYDG